MALLAFVNTLRRLAGRGTAGGRPARLNAPRPEKTGGPLQPLLQKASQTPPHPKRMENALLPSQNRKSGGTAAPANDCKIALDEPVQVGEFGNSLW